MLGGTNIVVDPAINPAYSGAFYRGLEAAGNMWERLCATRRSTRQFEEVPIVGRAPAVRRWDGSRQPGGALEVKKTIRHLKFECSVGAVLDDLEDDQSGDLQRVIGEVGKRIANYPNKLVLGDLGDNAEVTTSRFGASWESSSAAFIDTDHSYPGFYTTNQDNDLTTNINTVADPTLAEFRTAVKGAIAAMRAFKDDQGELYWEGNPWQRILLVVPPDYEDVAMEYANSRLISAAGGQTGDSVENQMTGRVDVLVNAYASSVDYFDIIAEDTGGEDRPYLCSIRRDIRLQSSRSGAGEVSRGVFMDDTEHYGADIRLEGAFAAWQRIVRHKFT